MFHIPKLSSNDFGLFRSPGPGLGNLLFPISRALVGKSNYGGDFLYPTIRQFKVGTYIRGEKDKRTYGNNFRRRNSKDWGQWVGAKLSTKYKEDEIDDSFRLSEGGSIEYSGLKNYFHDLSGSENLIRDWINKNSTLINPIKEEYDIGIHIRMGDFVEAGNSESGHSIRSPIEWYQESYKVALELLGVKSPRVYLFTDDDPIELNKKLKIDSILADPSGNAITAITNLSRAKCIITSRSTFSMWAAFLGDSKAIWSNDFSLASSFAERKDLDFFV